jgi:hypothetical protein
MEPSPEDVRNPEAESDEALWSAIHRTWLEAAPLPESDVRDLVARSMEAYWDRRKEEAYAEVERETAELARRVADTFRNPVRQFWLDFVLAVLPAASILLALGLAQRSKILLPGWSPYVLSTIGLGLAVCSFLAISSQRRYPRWGWLRYSVGALAGGLIVASVGGPLFFSQDSATANVSKALAQDRFVRLGLSSLKCRQKGSFLRTNEEDELFSVSTAELSADTAVYRANLASLSGEVIASLTPESGKVLWTFGGHEEELGRFVVGKVAKIDSRKLRLEISHDSHEKFLDLVVDSGAVARELSFLTSASQKKIGDQVVVAFNPRTMRVLATALPADVLRVGSRLDRCLDWPPSPGPPRGDRDRSRP